MIFRYYVREYTIPDTALVRLTPLCVDASLLSPCTVWSVGLGLPTGIWVGLQAARSRLNVGGWTGAVGVAMLVASLGCLGLGFSNLIGLGLGLLVGSAGMALVSAHVRFEK